MRKLLGVAPSATNDEVTKSYVDVIQGARQFVTLNATGTATANATHVMSLAANATITLPATPTNGTVCSFSRLDATAFTASIQPGTGNTIIGTSPYVLMAGQFVSFTYQAANSRWVPVGWQPSGSSGLIGLASAPTALTVVSRDSSGRAQFADPSAPQDAATKGYVDDFSIAEPQTITDWNSITGPGFYYAASAANGPKSATFTAMVMCDPTNANDLTLTATRLVSSDNPEIWFRQRRGDTAAWNSWYQVMGAPVWHALSFTSGYSAQTFGYTPGCALSGANQVVLRGVIRNTAGSAIASGTAVATLPVGFRPIEDVETAVATTNTTAFVTSNARLEITSDGQLTLVYGTSGSPTWLSLDGTTFWLA